MNFIYLFLVFFLLVLSIDAIPLKHQDYANSMPSVRMTRVPAEIVLIDFPLIRRDFPELRNATEPRIRSWLLHHASYFRHSQIAHNLEHCAAGQCIHSPLEPSADGVLGFTSPLAKRSVFVQAHDEAPGFGFPSQQQQQHLPALDTHTVIGYLELKGSGSASPLPYDRHANGVMRMDEAVREFLMAQVLRGLCSVLAPPDRFPIVENYAVLRVDAWSRTTAHDPTGVPKETWPAGVPLNNPASRVDLAVLVRQAVPRVRSYEHYLAPDAMQVLFESVLHAFNMTSMSFFFDTVYSGTHTERSTNFLFLDAQTAGYSPHQAFIDFNLVRFYKEGEQESYAGRQVFPLPVLFYNNETKTGCVDFISSTPVLTAEECNAYLRTHQPIWQVPSQRTALPPEYNLQVATQPWAEQRYDFSALFAPEERDEIQRLTSMGYHYAFSEDPQFLQRIADKLQSHFALLPRMKHSILPFFKSKKNRP